ncbi:MAG TPA: hypothetical protein VFD36_15325 [Kofleriaceae bacterium]|nr:hypothetical protein [Kofleriaceae bacterium]
MLTFLLWLVSLLGGPGAALPLDAPPPPPVHGSECDSGDCGNSNGTQMTGLAVDVTGDIRAIMLSSGEAFTLR